MLTKQIHHDWPLSRLHGMACTAPAWLWPVAALVTHPLQAAAEFLAALPLLPLPLESALHNRHNSVR